jgi:hypothetical protein
VHHTVHPVPALWLAPATWLVRRRPRLLLLLLLLLELLLLPIMQRHVLRQLLGVLRKQVRGATGA